MAIASAQGAMSAVERSMRSVFVGNIPYEATEEQLKDVFSEVGPVVSFRLVYDRETGKPKGYGFCEYKDQETALSAMRNLNGHELNGRPLRVDNAASEKSKEELKNLQASMGGPPVESPYGLDIEPEKAPEAISKAVASLPPEQMYELMKQMKLCIQNNPNEARNMLLQNPQLAFALLQAQVIMRIVDPQVALSILHRQNPSITALLPTPQDVNNISAPNVIPNNINAQPVNQVDAFPQQHSGVNDIGGRGPYGPMGGAQPVVPQQNVMPVGGPRGGPTMTRPSLLGDRPNVQPFNEPVPRTTLAGPPIPPFQDARGRDAYDPRMEGVTMGDRDLRQQQMADRDLRPPPMLDRDLRQPQQMGDHDLRHGPLGMMDNRIPYDPRFRGGATEPQRQQQAPSVPYDPRLGARSGQPFDQRGSYDMRTPAPAMPARAEDPRAVQQPMAPPQVRPAQPQAPRMAPAMGPQAQAPTPPRPQAPGAPTLPGVSSQDQEKAALIMQVLQLSDQQIALLPPEQRQSIMILKEQIARSAQQQ